MVTYSCQRNTSRWSLGTFCNVINAAMRSELNCTWEVTKSNQRKLVLEGFGNIMQRWQRIAHKPSPAAVLRGTQQTGHVQSEVTQEASPKAGQRRKKELRHAERIVLCKVHFTISRIQGFQPYLQRVEWSSIAEWFYGWTIRKICCKQIVIVYWLTCFCLIFCYWNGHRRKMSFCIFSVSKIYWKCLWP